MSKPPTDTNQLDVIRALRSLDWKADRIICGLGISRSTYQRRLRELDGGDTEPPLSGRSCLLLVREANRE